MTTFQTGLAFISILVYARILGKEQVGQLTVYDYITGITFGDLAAMIAIGGTEKIWQHLWALTVFVALAFSAAFITEKSRPLRKLIEGEPTVVIHNGKILEDNMRRMRYSVDNLMTQLRDKNIFNIADVEYAILETNGSLSVLPKSQHRPVTPQDLQLPTQYEGVPTELVVDGQVIYPNLQQLNLDEQWLIAELQKQGFNSVRDVVYASLDASGKLYIDQRRDNLQFPVDVDDK
ncbi:MAG: DUF421 domain-containing protein [Firmicutes bacterium]|nr:DUF421 domain-containing protein [Bacillota bacterium]